MAWFGRQLPGASESPEKKLFTIGGIEVELNFDPTSAPDLHIKSNLTGRDKILDIVAFNLNSRGQKSHWGSLPSDQYIIRFRETDSNTMEEILTDLASRIKSGEDLEKAHSEAVRAKQSKKATFQEQHEFRQQQGKEAKLRPAWVGFLAFCVKKGEAIPAEKMEKLEQILMNTSLGLGRDLAQEAIDAWVPVIQAFFLGESRPLLPTDIKALEGVIRTSYAEAAKREGKAP